MKGRRLGKAARRVDQPIHQGGHGLRRRGCLWRPCGEAFPTPPERGRAAPGTSRSVEMVPQARASRRSGGWGSRGIRGPGRGPRRGVASACVSRLCSTKSQPTGVHHRCVSRSGGGIRGLQRTGSPGRGRNAPPQTGVMRFRTYGSPIPSPSHRRRRPHFGRRITQ
jgi:hypothetical protein